VHAIKGSLTMMRARKIIELESEGKICETDGIIGML
jgi:hypothetical protein